MDNWQNINPDSKYWHRGNRGFNSQNAKFICPNCHHEVSFNLVCEDCGGKSWVLGRSMGLPGIFCESCKMGTIVWSCPSCGQDNQRLFLSLYYNPSKLSITKRGWFS
jgi:hypothetical protein